MLPSRPTRRGSSAR